MTNRCLLGAWAALALALGSAQAHAQLWPTGAPGAWYIGPEGGWTKLTNQTDQVSPSHFTGPGGGVFSFPGTSPTANFNSGFNVGARAGYQWGPWRFEEEYSYRHSGLNTLTGGPFAISTNPSNVTGQRNSHAIMTNAIYDFTIGWPVSPHLGVGIGAVDVIDSASANSFTLRNPIGSPIVPNTPLSVAPQTFGGTLLHGSTWQFGYQAIAGLRYDFSPAVSFDLDYRYLATTQPTFTIPNTPLRYRSSYHTNNFVASLIYRFAPPPPPTPVPVAAPAVPPPAPPRPFLVFFDWDRADITPAGMDIARQAASTYKAGGSIRIEVNGYTDLSGSPGYNQRLSVRRAANVANALARLGVARSDMAVSGRGENDPRVPTAPGVREPQNRRVEIVFP